MQHELLELVFGGRKGGKKAEESEAEGGQLGLPDLRTFDSRIFSSKRDASGIRWSEGMITRIDSGSMLRASSAATAIAGAVFRPIGSNRIFASGRPAC